MELAVYYGSLFKGEDNGLGQQKFQQDNLFLIGCSINCLTIIPLIKRYQ